MSARVTIGRSNNHTMSTPKGSAGMMAAFLERAGYSGEFRATVFTMVRGGPKAGITIGQLRNRSAVLIYVQTSGEGDSKRSYNLMVPPGADPDEFFRRLKETEALIKEESKKSTGETFGVVASVESDGSASDLADEMLVIDSLSAVGDNSTVETDEETDLIAEAFDLDEEGPALEKRLASIDHNLKKRNSGLSSKQVEEARLRRRLEVLTFEIIADQADVVEFESGRTAARERFLQIVARREEIDIRLNELSAQRQIDAVVGQAKTRFEVVFLDLQGLTPSAREQALKEIVAMFGP